MKPSLIDTLACPICEGKLELKVAGEKGRGDSDWHIRMHEVWRHLPHYHSIPVLLPPEKAGS